MGGITRVWVQLKASRGLLFPLSVGIFILAIASWLRDFPFAADFQLYGYFQTLAGVMALTFAANALVRFRGLRDRFSLILALGFLFSGLFTIGSSLAFFRLAGLDPAEILRIPEAWWLSRMLLALALVAALVVEKRIPTARNPAAEMAGALIAVAAVTYLASAIQGRFPSHLFVHRGSLTPSPWNLLSAGVFLFAAIGYRRRLKSTDSAFDWALFLAASLNVACHLAASQSERLMDASFALAQTLKVASYAVALAGALVDNSRLFSQVHHLATSDALTGLANYRRLVEVIDGEIQRSGRTGRPFAVLLLDLDGLKNINDRHGHLTGSQALRRLANILRIHCRSIDTAARYGGDEFALILPETSEHAATQVAVRIRERLARDGEMPPLSVSVGLAVYPRDGTTIEKLLAAADRALYERKLGRKLLMSEFRVSPESR